jgi:hypothetical protein
MTAHNPGAKMSLVGAARRLPATSPISVESSITEYGLAQHMLRSLVAAASAIAAAVRSLADARDRIVLAISRAKAPCRPEGTVGERKLADSLDSGITSHFGTLPD